MKRFFTNSIALPFWASPNSSIYELMLRSRTGRRVRRASALDPGFPARRSGKEPPVRPVRPIPTDVPVPEPHDVPVREPMDVPPPDPGKNPNRSSRCRRGLIRNHGPRRNSVAELRLCEAPADPKRTAGAFFCALRDGQSSVVSLMFFKRTSFVSVQLADAVDLQRDEAVGRERLVVVVGEVGGRYAVEPGLNAPALGDDLEVIPFA